MVTQIDPISTPPTPADPPDVFEGRASQVWADLFKAVPQMNAQAQEIEAIGQAAVAAGQSAQEDSDAALCYRNESRAARDAAQGYQTAASGFSAAAGVARTGAESAASSAADAAGRADASAAAAAGVLANAVQQTSATGAAMLPEGVDAQRPVTGSIPAGAFVLRGSTQSGSDYFCEYWDRLAAAWKTFADRTWVGQQIAIAVQAVKDWVDQKTGTVIIYPNGGSAASPALVSANTRYSMPNPFPGFNVEAEAQIDIGGVWGKPGWDGNSGSAAVSYGVSAGRLISGATDVVIVQTGSVGVAVASNLTGGIHGYTGAAISSAYCRVVVRKVGG